MTLPNNILLTVNLIPEILLKFGLDNLCVNPASIAGLYTELQSALEMASPAIRPRPVVNRLVGGQAGEVGVVENTLWVKKDI